MKEKIADLLLKTGHAHHEAYIETDGADPEWPLFYAKEMHEELNQILGTELTQSQIVFELVRLDQEAEVNDEHWTVVYAADLINKYHS